MSKTLLIMCVGVSLIGCSPSVKAATIDDVVREIVKHAAAGDTEFFAQYMDPSYKGQERRIVEQIKASGMAENYKNRVEYVSEMTARLNYHYLEKGCHFQVDIEKQNGSWIIRKIWFCR